VSPSSPERLRLGLQLLDRQIVDREDRIAGKVDDLELTEPGDGGAPVVTAILSGRGALAHRLGGRLGRIAEALSRRLLPQETEDGRIEWDDVVSIGSCVKVNRDRDELATATVERAVRTAFIERIPGSGKRGTDADQ
jgi:sporulation protein YlmC with PRC-barrel domain